MRKLAVLLVLFLLLSVTSGVLGCGNGGEEAPTPTPTAAPAASPSPTPEPVTLKLGHSVPIGHNTDLVAQEFPELRMVIAHMGYPWLDQTVVLLGKHPQIYADVAGLLRQPWLAYNALLSAYEYGVIDKLLFGSNFPFRSPAACIEVLYSVNQISHGTSLPAVPREQLRGIVERDTLSLLGIGPASGPVNRTTATILREDD